MSHGKQSISSDFAPNQAIVRQKKLASSCANSEDAESSIESSPKKGGKRKRKGPEEEGTGSSNLHLPTEEERRNAEPTEEERRNAEAAVRPQSLRGRSQAAVCEPRRPKQKIAGSTNVGSGKLAAARDGGKDAAGVELDEWGWPKGTAVVIDLLRTLKQDGGGNKKAANAGDADFPKWGRVQQIFDNRLAEKAAQEREREREQKEAKKAFVQYVPIDTGDAASLHSRLTEPGNASACVHFFVGAKGCKRGKACRFSHVLSEKGKAGSSKDQTAAARGVGEGERGGGKERKEAQCFCAGCLRGKACRVGT